MSRRAVASHGTLPANAGIGLRSVHHSDFLSGRPRAAWLEVHSENFFAAGGAALLLLERVRDAYPLSLHGVGLGVGSVDDIDVHHLAKLRALIERFEPAAVSEHLCWGAVGGRHLNDLLPLPYTVEALNHVVDRIDYVQNALRRTILIENVSSYLQFNCSSMPEWEFITAVSRQSGCGILLDVNNVYVSARNHGLDASSYLSAIPSELIGEIHLAGHSINQYQDREIRVDTHSTFVCDDVWHLYASIIERVGPVPTLIEWDVDVPTLDVLLGEAVKAQRFLDAVRDQAA